MATGSSTTPITDAIREAIREEIREELRRAATPQRIQSTAAIASRHIRESLLSLPTLTSPPESATATPDPTRLPEARSRVQHASRVPPVNLPPRPVSLPPPSKKAKNAAATASPRIGKKTFDVVLLYQDMEQRAEYRFGASDMAAVGSCLVEPHDKEDPIREKLTTIFKAKFPLIHKRCFEFVKVNKNTVKDYLVAPDHKYDAFGLRALAGQGRLYCRLIVPSEDLLELDDSEEPDEDIALLDELEEDTVLPSTPEVRRSISPPSNALLSSDAEQVINDLLDQQSIPDYTTVPEDQVMADLRAIYTGDKYKIKLKREEALEECFIAYKDPEMDQTSLLRIDFKDESGIDTGGLARNFFSIVFEQMQTGIPELPYFFEGADGNMLPIGSGSLAQSMYIVGEVFAHAICQTAIGPSFLAEPIYNYLCSGDFESALCGLSIKHATPKCGELLEKVSF